MQTNQDCPDCGEPLSLVKLGSEPIRETCGRFGCSFEARTVSKEYARKVIAT